MRKKEKKPPRKVAMRPHIGNKPTPDHNPDGTIASRRPEEIMVEIEKKGGMGELDYRVKSQHFRGLPAYDRALAAQRKK